MDPLLTYKNVL